MQRSVLKAIFWMLLALTLVSLGALGVIDQDLKTAASPIGIISFELCAYSHSCAAILQSWSSHAKLMAVLSLGLDYLFMALYPATIFAGLLLVSTRVPTPFRQFTVWSAWLAWVAGIADAFENYFLAQMVLKDSVQGLAWLATISATVKFAFLGYTLAWLIFSSLLVGFRKH